MNSFPRRSNFQGHLISSLPNHAVCSECHGIFIYACGDEVETLTCAKDQNHSGLVDKKDVILEPVTLVFTHEQHAMGIRSLFGDE